MVCTRIGTKDFSHLSNRRHYYFEYISANILKSFLKTLWRSVNFTPFRYSNGCWWTFRLKMFRKNGEHALRITLCACICSFSHAMVTSKKSLSSRNSRKAQLMLDSKSFHRRQNFSELILSWIFWKWKSVSVNVRWYNNQESAGKPGETNNYRLCAVFVYNVM